MTLRIVGSVGFILLLALTAGIFGSIDFFVDLPSLVFVLGSGFFMALGAEAVNRNEMFAQGSVLGGWIGFLFGLVMMANTLDLSDLQKLASALGVLFLCPLYGYIVRYIVSNMKRTIEN